MVLSRQHDLAAENERLRRCLQEAGENAERAFLLMAELDAERNEEVQQSRAQTAEAFALLDRVRSRASAEQSLEHHVRALEQEVQGLQARLHASEQAAARLRARCETQSAMMGELSHRLKNSLALVQAMVSQTLREPATLAAGRAALLARVVALGQAHRVLVEERWLGTTVRKTVEMALATHGGPDATERFEVVGRPVRLGSRQTVALSMALHELATNATKYGALSCEAGRVRIAWHTSRREDGRWLYLCWSEHGGPPVAPPTRCGFGSRLIERTIKDTLGGEVRLSFEPGGVVCTMTTIIQSARQS